LDVIGVSGNDGASRNPWTHLHVFLRQHVVDVTMSTYFLLRGGVPPSFTGEEYKEKREEERAQKHEKA
jgi:hypothetical protein